MTRIQVLEIDLLRGSNIEANKSRKEPLNFSFTLQKNNFIQAEKNLHKLKDQLIVLLTKVSLEHTNNKVEQLKPKSS